MKVRTDFVSNSSSCCYMLPISEDHDEKLWLKNTLRAYPDNGKVQMRFDDFSHNETFSGLMDNWKFICTQLIYWVIPEVAEGTDKSKKRILRELYNSEEFCRLNEAVKNYMIQHGVDYCTGIELDEEEIIDHHEDGENYRVLRESCGLDHESIFEGFDDMMKQAKCKSIAELIWGLKEIKISWN